LAVAALVAAGLYLYRGSAPAPEAAEAVAVPTPEQQPEPEAAAPEATAQAPQPNPEAPSTPDMPAPPAIDTFRMEPDGQMIIAGRAAPGWDVSILIDEEAMGSAASDGSGKFVQFLDVPASSVPRVLSLNMRSTEDGREVRSTDEVLIAPTPQPAPEHAGAAPQTEAEPETVDSAPSGTLAMGSAPEPDTSESDGTAPPEPVAEDVAGMPPADAAAEAPTESAPDLAQTAPSLAESAPEAPEPRAPAVEAAAAPETVSPPEPQQPTVLLSNEAGVRVLQAPQERAPEVMSSVALDAITYSQTGEVELSGRGQGEGFVRIYLDNQPITTSRIQEDGGWQSALPDVDTGVYTLRVDEVSAEGEVISRVETPFKREDEAVLATRNQSPEAPRLDVVTVQPGSTLWAISRERYGQGILYVRVFAANRDRIRDPDLIYPGQVFELPE
jgi:nucleoid-associated protein YgaU